MDERIGEVTRGERKGEKRACCSSPSFVLKTRPELELLMDSVLRPYTSCSVFTHLLKIFLIRSFKCNNNN